MSISKELLKNFYWMMKRIRLCEESLIEHIISGAIQCPVHLYSGEEAIATGVCSALSAEDLVFGNHRSHGHFLAKGGNMSEMIAEIYGKESGCSRGRGGSMHLIDPGNGVIGVTPIVAGSVSLATGSALAARIKKETKVTVSFFGDGASGEGGLYESLNFAALKKLPIIFICENNLYSTHLPVTQIRVERKISEIARPFGIKSCTADGNDVLEVYKIARRAVSLCRRGLGPVFIEFLTFRLRGHVGPSDTIKGNHHDIRPKEQINLWKEKDPLHVYKMYLLEKGFFSESELNEVDKICSKEVDDANKFAIDGMYPDKSELTRYVFKER